MKSLSGNCPRFEQCSAPLCPLDEKGSLPGVWYPDEEICKKTPAPKWVRRQRKIAKKTGNKDTYFTYEMLSRDCKIAKGIVGLDPDKDDQMQSMKWLSMHPVKRELSIAEKKIIAERFKKSRDKKNKK